MKNINSSRKCTRIGLVLVFCVLFLSIARFIITDIKEKHVSSMILSALSQSSKNNLCNPAEHSVERYEKIKGYNKKYYIAANLHNNAQIMSDFILQLFELIEFLSPDNVFVNIYESGSDDQTKTNLYFLSVILDMQGVKHLIRGGDEKLDYLTHRIEYLARMRNNVLSELSTQKDDYAKIIFMNDVFYCADDVKELIYQSLIQNADLTCSLDFDIGDSGLGFYDTWVSRDVDGNMFTKRPMWEFVSHIPSKERLKQRLPFPVFCCWNGIVVLNTEPFKEPYSFTFSRTYTKRLIDPRDERVVKYSKNRPLYEECSESEISRMCIDFAKYGFHRKLVVPRAQVAYDWSAYQAIRERASPLNSPFRPEEDELFEYDQIPETVECHPLERPGRRSPDGILGDEILVDVVEEKKDG